MNWDDLKIVDAAGRTLSLSAAARELGVSQPQLSRRLRQLESDVGVRLFDRTPKGLKPTSAGERLLPLAADVRIAADAVQRALPDLGAASMTTVRISVDEMRERLLTDGLADLMARTPDVSLEIVSAHRHIDLLRRETEIQLRTCLPETDTLVARRVGSIAYAVYAAPDYVASTPAALTAARTEDCDWIGFAADDNWYSHLRRWMCDRLTRPPVLGVNTMTGALDAAAAGVGLTIAPMFMADLDKRLERVSEPIDVLTTTENLIVHRDLLREPAVRKTVDAIVHLYRERRKALSGDDAAQPRPAAQAVA